MKEIVAAIIGTVITNHRSHIVATLELKQSVGLLDRQTIELMAKFDLGERWKALAAAPTLFLIDDDDKAHNAEPPQ